MPTFQQDARITVKKRNVTWTHERFGPTSRRAFSRPTDSVDVKLVAESSNGPSTPGTID
jgi:hypothetical protein